MAGKASVSEAAAETVMLVWGKAEADAAGANPAAARTATKTAVLRPVREWFLM
jgi:hypothetical protein